MAVKGTKITPMRVTPHNPSAKALRILVFLGVFVACAAASYFAGVYQVAQQQASHANQYSAQQQTLSQEIIQLRTSVDIDRQTIEDLRQLVMAQKAQISAHERDLRVYKDLLSPNAKINPLGLSFGVFTVSPLKEVGHFNYSLAVQKLSTKDTDFSGLLEFRIIGQQAGNNVQLSLYQVSSQVTVPSIPVKFKYFQTLEGDLTLPVDFVPQTVELVVKSEDKRTLVTSELDWPASPYTPK